MPVCAAAYQLACRVKILSCTDVAIRGMLLVQLFGMSDVQLVNSRSSNSRRPAVSDTIAPASCVLVAYCRVLLLPTSAGGGYNGGGGYGGGGYGGGGYGGGAGGYQGGW